MRVLITGANGFLGSYVVKLCSALNWTSIVLERQTSDKKRLQGYNDRISVVYTDLEDGLLADTVQSLKPDCFIHMGWKGIDGISRNDPDQISYNLPLSLKTVSLAQKSGCKHWIGIGSLSEYGMVSSKVNESHLTEPFTLYSKAKLATCWATSALCQAYQLKWSWVRVGSIFGPGDNNNWLIPYVIKTILKGDSPRLTPSEQKWDYLYVEDAASALLSIARVQAEGIYNLGSGTSDSIKNIVNEIIAIIGSNIKPEFGALAYPPNQITHMEADITRIKKVTQWQPATSFLKGISNTIATLKMENI